MTVHASYELLFCKSYSNRWCMVKAVWVLPMSGSRTVSSLKYPWHSSIAISCTHVSCIWYLIWWTGEPRYWLSSLTEVGWCSRPDTTVQRSSMRNTTWGDGGCCHPNPEIAMAVQCRDEAQEEVSELFSSNAFAPWNFDTQISCSSWFVCAFFLSVVIFHVRFNILLINQCTCFWSAIGC